MLDKKKADSSHEKNDWSPLIVGLSFVVIVVAFIVYLMGKNLNGGYPAPTMNYQYKDVLHGFLEGGGTLREATWMEGEAGVFLERGDVSRYVSFERDVAATKNQCPTVGAVKVDQGNLLVYAELNDQERSPDMEYCLIERVTKGLLKASEEIELETNPALIN